MTREIVHVLSFHRFLHSSLRVFITFCICFCLSVFASFLPDEVKAEDYTLSRARNSFLYGDYQNALHTLNGFLQIKGHSIQELRDAYLLTARCLFALERFAEAKESYKEVLARDRLWRPEPERFTPPEIALFNEALEEHEAWWFKRERLSFLFSAGLGIALLPGIELTMESERPVTMISLGAGIDYLLMTRSPALSIRSTISYANKGCRGSRTESGNEYKTEIELHYLEIPVLLVSTWNGPQHTKPFILGGIYTAFSLPLRHAEKNMITVTQEFDDELNSFDLGIVVGGGLQLMTYKPNSIFLEVRYSVGLRYINKTSGWIDHVKLGAARNQSLAIFLGIRLQ